MKRAMREIFSKNLFMNKMIINFKVFGPSMKFIVTDEGDSRDIIAP